MYYVRQRTSDQRNYDGFDFDVFSGKCLNRSILDLVTTENHLKFPEAEIVVNAFSQNQIFVPHWMGNPVMSSETLSASGIAKLIGLTLKRVSVKDAYYLECPTGKALDDYLVPGENSSVLLGRLLEKHRCTIPEFEFFELLCFRRPSDHGELCKGSEVVTFIPSTSKLEKPIEIPTALVEHFGVVRYCGFFFRDDVFDAIREHIDEDVFTIQHG